MGEQVYETSATRVLDAPRDVVWGLVADTDRWDRAAGLQPGTYRWEEVDGQQVRVGSAREVGQEIEWIEPPYEWLEGRFVQGERVFRKGPAARGGMRIQLAGEADGTRVTVTFYVRGSAALLRLAGPIVRRRFARGLRAYLDSVEHALARARSADGDQAQEPGVVRARRLLMGGYDPVVSGPRTEPNRSLLEQRAATLRQAGVEEAVVDAIVRHLAERPDEEVTQIRPFELARAWGLERREMLRGFLHAVLAGLVDLQWQINCPVCRVAASTATSLEEVRSAVHCDACRIDYDVDFGDHVEAVFQSSSAIRAVQPAVYCDASPAFRPHVLGQLRLEPGERREELAVLPEGALHLRNLRGPQRGDVEVSPRGTLHVEVDDDGLAARFEAGDDGRVVVESAASQPVTLLLERSGWSADAALGSVVASLPEFLDLFATEAPAAGVELTVSKLALLFTDLTGSTALYERVGDAKAFAAVQAHFRSLEAVVAEHDGAIVKTMGDAIMASFSSPEQAVRAALAMVPVHDARFADQGLGLRVGVHCGPCLAVRANERLDFFGTTVNMASRLEAKAPPGHVVLTEALAEDPEVRASIEGRARETLEADLKGIRQAQRLVVVDARDAEASSRAAAS